MSPRLYRALTVAGGPAIALLLAWRRARGKEDAARFGERLGIASVGRPAGPLVWLHAASVGEATSALALVERLLARDSRLAILVTTGTVTSARVMAERLPPRAIHHYVPVDRPAAVRRFLAHWRPDLAIWLESELWPNLVLETKRRRVPMLMVNGRMSDRSLAGWRRWPSLIRPLLQAFALILAQGEADAARFRALGAGSVLVTGTLKYDAARLPADDAELERMSAMLEGRPRWLAASTHEGEESIAADVHKALKQHFPGLVTIIAPRHPERGPRLAVLLAKRGLAVARRGAGEAIERGCDVYIADSMGELGLFYRLSRVVFVGGSLVPHGGQNPLEPALLGSAILHGPHIGNFQPVADALAKVGASATVTDSASLAAEVARLLSDDKLCARRGAAACAAAAAGRGVLERVVTALLPWLDELGDARERPAEASIAHA